MTAFPNQVVDVLRKADAVCFDVDSTVISEEGIDALADFKGVGEQVAALTARFLFELPHTLT